MYLLPILAILLTAGHAGPANGVIVEVNAIRWGEFQSVQQSPAEDPVYILTDGWVRKGFFRLWPGSDNTRGDMESPGQHVRITDGCDSHAVTISRLVGSGLREKKQSWTLIDACPVAWEITATDASGEKLRLTELRIVASEIAVAR